ncbi:hypothetical protein Mame01_13360 [Microbispora amethystogenes]|nr:hypothetical protein Mame01_13360 [Microbispora amethystogenes]
MAHPTPFRPRRPFAGAATRKRRPYGREVARTAVVALSQEAVQVSVAGTALVLFQLAWKPNTVDAPGLSEPL